ncbi:MAG: selenocysteine-specific translation elongation factor [Pyrinomonadaceae bacterium]
MEVIVGTAGHIDHGKTALVKALTGIDADRLPEEKRRGITVDLGFAAMSALNVHFGFVDVPGHERFVKNMLAGASGIDIVMLIIAADEGVMPQTREHFDICRLLGIRAGMVVLTKTDLVDDETLDLAKLEAAELVTNSFLANAPMICVSSRSGDGIEALKETLVQICTNLQRRDDDLVTRLPIDRSFSMKGFGAVVTGTLASGEIAEGSEMELLPDRLKVRVRGLQTHGQSVRSASAGQRVAVNLGGIDHAKITRGMVLVEPNIMRPTQIFDAEIEVLPKAAKSLRSRQRIRVHIGAVEVLARIQVLDRSGEIASGENDLAQIRLEMPVLAVPGERFIIRSYSPQATIAGGQVIDPLAAKHRPKDIDAARRHLENLIAATDDKVEKIRLIVNAAGPSGESLAGLQARTALKKVLLNKAIGANVVSGAIVDVGGHYIASWMFDEFAKLVEGAIKLFHKQEPLAKGIARESLRDKIFANLPAEIFEAVIASLGSSGKIVLDRETIRLTYYKTTLSPSGDALSKKILSLYQSAGLEVPKLDDALAEVTVGTNFTWQDARKYFQFFLDAGEIVKVSEEFYFERKAIGDLIQLLRSFAAKADDRLIDMSEFKELAGISRKYAIPLLEYFDRERITRRVGDKRVILYGALTGPDNGELRGQSIAPLGPRSARNGTGSR